MDHPAGNPNSPPHCRGHTVRRPCSVATAWHTLWGQGCPVAYGVVSDPSPSAQPFPDIQAGDRWSGWEMEAFPTALPGQPCGSLPVDQGDCCPGWQPDVGLWRPTRCRQPCHPPTLPRLSPDQVPGMPNQTPPPPTPIPQHRRFPMEAGAVSKRRSEALRSGSLVTPAAKPPQSYC